MNIVMDASHDQMDRVDRATIRVDCTSPQGRGQKDVKGSEQGVLQIGCKNDASMKRLPGNEFEAQPNQRRGEVDWKSPLC